MARYSTGERTKERLIEAAGELAAERGFASVSTRDVAKRAGENLGSIHYHFGGKDGLFEEVVNLALKPQVDNPLSQVLAQYEGDLDDPAVKAEAVSRGIRWFMETVFALDRPKWCSRVIYQLLRSQGPLRNLLTAKVMDPSSGAFESLLRRVDPSMSKVDAVCELLVICAPIFFHADYSDVVAGKLGSSDLEPSYLGRLERRILERTLWALGLPGVPCLSEEEGQS
ncbi:MAG: helix-turn-helix domain containing protein [Dethiosulfovibrio sp.]|nr:helix-turn-helix domain containing protein [Dethiosulfovibrio sp.]